MKKNKYYENCTVTSSAKVYNELVEAKKELEEIKKGLKNGSIIENENTKLLITKEYIINLFEKHKIAHELAQERLEKIIYLERNIKQWSKIYNEESNKNFKANNSFQMIQRTLEDKRLSKKQKLKMIQDIVNTRYY